MKKLTPLGVSFVAVGSDQWLSDAVRAAGLTPVSGHEVIIRKAAEAAFLFAEARNLKKSFSVHGGSFFTATRTLLRLLEETSDAYLSSIDSDAVREAVSDACGASLRDTAPDDAIVIDFSDDAFFISHGNDRMSFSDFSVSIPCHSFGDLPVGLLPALSEILETCGFLADTETKTELLSK